MAHVVDVLDAPSSCESGHRRELNFEHAIIVFSTDRDSRSNQSRWEQEALLESTATLYIGEMRLNN